MERGYPQGPGVGGMDLLVALLGGGGLATVPV